MIEGLSVNPFVFENAVPNGHARNLLGHLVCELKELEDVVKIMVGSSEDIAKLYIFTKSESTGDTEEAVSTIYGHVFRTNDTRKLVEITQVAAPSFVEAELKDRPDFLAILFYAPTDRGEKYFDLPRSSAEVL